MALISKASLLMVPSTYEPGTLYNVLPSGNRAPDSTDQNSGYDQTRADFDFDRGSNAAATRIGSDGLIKKYRENKLLRSNKFDTTWTKSSATIASGQSGYDGTSDAWLFTTSVAGASLEQSITAAGVVVFSLYAKANSVNGVRLRIDAATDANGYFNLSTGAVHSFAGSAIDASITAIGEGWYRCEVAANISSPVKVAVYTTDGTTSYDNGSIYIQSAQLETGLVATDVLTSGATTAKAGVLVDLPRINYDANGENGSLLLEPSRQQLLPYSEDFSNSVWGKVNVTLTSNDTISPDGTQNASKIVATGGDGSLQDSIAVTSGTTYTLSVYLKTVSGTLDTAISLGSPGFPQNEGEGGRYKNITVTNEWKRYTLTSTADASATTGIGVGGFNSFTTGEEVYVWGAQLEVGAYATSYIPNHGTTGGITRAADSCGGGGSAESINSTEGVLYAEISALADDFANYKFISLYDGTFDNFCDIYFGDASNRISARFRSGSGSVINMFFAVSDVTASNKVAISWKSNEFKFFVNGVSRGLNTSGSAPTGLNTLDFHQVSNANTFSGNVKQVALFNEALSDSELATLTTL